MAIVNVLLFCGCGRKFGSVEGASEHADEKGHTLNAQGTIMPSVRKAKTILVSPSDRARSYAQRPVVSATVSPPAAHVAEVEATEAAAEDSRFSDLRARLQAQGKMRV